MGNVPKGPSAFLRDDVKAALKYTPEQERTLADQVDEGWSRIRDLTNNETAAEAYAGAMKAVLDGLTKDQQKAWGEMTGKPFPMPEIVVRKMLHAHVVAGARGAAPPGAPVPLVPGVAFPPAAAPGVPAFPPVPGGKAGTPPAPPKG